MPTVLRKNGFRFFFYSNEGTEPAHIHIVGRNGELKVWMNPVAIAKTYNLSPKDQKEAIKIVLENRQLILDKWEEWHESNR